MNFVKWEKTRKSGANLDQRKWDENEDHKADEIGKVMISDSGDIEKWGLNGLKKT